MALDLHRKPGGYGWQASPTASGACSDERTVGITGSGG